MVDAVAKAAGVSGSLVRRALMLSGDLTGTAEVALAEGVAGLRGIGFEPFRPILTMPASTAESVGKAVASFDRASVEWKLDGSVSSSTGAATRSGLARNLNEITHAVPGSSTRYAASRSSRPFSTARRCGCQATVAQIDSDASSRCRRATSSGCATGDGSARGTGLLGSSIQPRLTLTGPLASCAAQ
jgi:hypothetical protein